MAELAKSTGTILLERSGTLIAEHQPPKPALSMDYPNERAAIAVFRKRIVELVAQGWQLSRGDNDIGAPIAVELGIEAQLHAQFDGDALAIYNDWLIDRGDPCGEVAALRAKQIDTSELEKARGYELYGSFADLLAHRPSDRPRIAPAWSHGWIEGWRLHHLAHGTLLAFAMHAPLARFANRLVVWHDVHAPTVRYALARTSRRKAIRYCTFAEVGMATQLLGVLPNLETLTMPSGETVGHDRVRNLTLEIDELHDQPMITGAWPALERLTLRAQKQHGSVVARLLEQTPLEKLLKLRHVDVDVFKFDASVYERIASRLRDFTAAWESDPSP